MRILKALARICIEETGGLEMKVLLLLSNNPTRVIVEKTLVSLHHEFRICESMAEVRVAARAEMYDRVIVGWDLCRTTTYEMASLFPDQVPILIIATDNVTVPEDHLLKTRSGGYRVVHVIDGRKAIRKAVEEFVSTSSLS